MAPSPTVIRSVITDGTRLYAGAALAVVIAPAADTASTPSAAAMVTAPERLDTTEPAALPAGAPAATVAVVVVIVGPPPVPGLHAPLEAAHRVRTPAGRRGRGPRPSRPGRSR